MGRSLTGLLIALWVVSAGAAVSEGRTSAGHRYLAGGIGTDEVEAMQAEAPRFTLQLITAAKSGAYVAGAHIRLAGPGNEVLLDTTIEGPWLLVDLPAGRYSVRATHSGATVERQLTLTPGNTQKVVLHFDAIEDNVIPALPGSARPRRP